MARLVSERDSCDAIDTYVEKELQHLNMLGAAFAIFEGDETVHTPALVGNVPMENLFPRKRPFSSAH